MEKMHSLKRQRCDTMDEDIISKLPNEIRAKIISRLPTMDAIGMRILSKDWISTWKSVSELKFVHPERHYCTHLDEESSSRFIKLVDLVLLQHEGPIRKFSISIYEECFSSLDGWLLILSRNGIEELFIENEPRYKKSTVPNFFYSCKTLRCMRLSYFNLDLPPSFAGFNLLRTLKLENISSSEDDLCRLIASCPLLEKLHLARFTSDQTIRISAPKLRFLTVKDCSFRQVRLETPLLEYGHLELDRILLPAAPRANNLIEALGCLSRIRYLVLRGFFMKYLSLAWSSGNTLPSTFNHLSALRLAIDISDREEDLAAIWLIENCPMLQKLQIEIRKDYRLRRSNPEVWKSREKISLKHLKFAVISNFDESDSAYALVKLLLSSAPLLRGLHVKGTTGGPLLLKRLLCFEKASAAAQLSSEFEYIE